MYVYFIYVIKYVRIYTVVLIYISWYDASIRKYLCITYL